MIWIVLGIVIGWLLARGRDKINAILIIFFAVFGFLFAGVIGEMWRPCFPGTAIIEKKNYSIIAFNDRLSSGGSFFLGSGSLGEKTYYVFYIKDEQGGAHLEKVDTNNAIIYEDRKNDGLLIVKERKLNVRLTLWCFAVMPKKTEYEFHIPSGSLVSNFKADLQ